MLTIKNAIYLGMINNILVLKVNGCNIFIYNDVTHYKLSSYVYVLSCVIYILITKMKIIGQTLLTTRHLHTTNNGQLKKFIPLVRSIKHVRK